MEWHIIGILAIVVIYNIRFGIKYILFQHIGYNTVIIEPK